MNLWGRAAGICFLAFLILIGCREDETSLLGFKKPDTKFKVSYIELDVPSSIMLIDSVRTFNDPTNKSAEKRLMVGRYVDPEFGVVTAQAYTQFRPLDTKVEIGQNAKLVSAYLNLTFDYYYYGGSGITTNTVFVHELTDSIKSETPYFSSSQIAFNPTPIGTGTFELDPLDFDRNGKENVTFIANSKTDSIHIDSLSIKLDASYAEPLFALAKSQSVDYTNFSRFKRVYKGFALTPGSDFRVVGFNPENTSVDPNNKITDAKSDSKVVMYYDEPDENGKLIRKKITFYLFARSSVKPQIGFTQISVDRSSTSFNTLTEPYSPIVPTGSDRYLQSGNPVMPKLDFSNFLSFADTIPNVVLNYAEFSIAIEDPGAYPPPRTLRLRVLKENNKFKSQISTPLTPLDTAVFTKYGRSITEDEEKFYIIGIALNQDQVAGNFDINYLEDSQVYSGDLTEFFQTLTKVRDDQVFKDFGLMALDPYYSRSVNRVVFKDSKVKLKIFYTVPVVDVK